jgi:bile acid:Na+ symporter, BASS family
LSNTLELPARLSVFAFAVSSMFSIGLSLTIQQILEPFKSTRLVLSAFVANFVLVPLSAYLITRAIPMDESLAIGLLLLGTASGAPLFPKLTEFAKGSLALAVGLMALQMAVTIVYMPLVLPMLLPGVHVGAWSIAKPLMMVALPPLAAGLFLRAYRKVLAVRLLPYFRAASNVALLLVILVGLAANFSSVVRLGSRTAITAGALLLLISLVVGFVLGGPDSGTRKVLALGTSQRNASVAFLVGIENYRESDVVTMLAILALVALCIQLPAALAMGRGRNRMDADSAQE